MSICKDLDIVPKGTYLVKLKDIDKNDSYCSRPAYEILWEIIHAPYQGCRLCSEFPRYLEDSKRTLKTIFRKFGYYRDDLEGKERLIEKICKVDVILRRVQGRIFNKIIHYHFLD